MLTSKKHILYLAAMKLYILKRYKEEINKRTAELLYFCALVQIIWPVVSMTLTLIQIVKLMQPSIAWSKRGLDHCRVVYMQLHQL